MVEAFIIFWHVNSSEPATKWVGIDPCVVSTKIENLPCRLETGVKYSTFVDCREGTSLLISELRYILSPEHKYQATCYKMEEDI